MLVVAIARASVAAGKVEVMNRNTILHGCTRHSSVSHFVVFVGAEYENRLGQRIYAPLKAITGQNVSGGVLDLHFQAIRAAGALRELEGRVLVHPGGPR